MEDTKKSLNLQLDAASNRIKELKSMYDKLHYNAERERKLELKLKKAKETIKMHRNYTRGNTLNLHATTDGILTMEQFRQVRRKKKGKKDINSITSFLTDIERLGLKSNMGKKLILNAGYKDVTKHGGGTGNGVFVLNKQHRNNVDNWKEREEGEDASDDQDNNGTDKENNDNMIMEDDQQDVEGEDAVTTDDDDVINNTRNAVARSEEI